VPVSRGGFMQNRAVQITQQKCVPANGSTTSFVPGTKCDGSGPASFLYPDCWTCCNSTDAMPGVCNGADVCSHSDGLTQVDVWHGRKISLITAAKGPVTRPCRQIFSHRAA
jgi:hypothetical protein